MSRGHNEEQLMEAVQLLLEFCCLYQLLCYSDLQTLLRASETPEPTLLEKYLT